MPPRAGIVAAGTTWGEILHAADVPGWWRHGVSSGPARAYSTLELVRTEQQQHHPAPWPAQHDYDIG